MADPAALNLLVAAAILWNTRYLAAAFTELEGRDQPIPPDLKRNAVPLSWQHISLTGDYVWSEQAQPVAGQLRPLGRRPSLLAA